MTVHHHSSHTNSAATEQTDWQHTPPPTPNIQQRYEPSDVGRIIVRASALQKTQEKTLSPEQIEAIAAEVGIAPEYVRRAMAHEETGTVTEQSATVHDAETIAPVSNLRLALSLGAIMLYGILVTNLLLYMQSQSMGFVWSANLFSVTAPNIFFVWPAVLAVGIGAAGRSRRWGAIFGASLGVAIIIATSILFPLLSLETVNIQDRQLFAEMMAAGALLGAAGAQARRIVSRRVVKSRGRRRSIARRVAEL